MNNPGPGVYQQSTKQIWQCVTDAVSGVLSSTEGAAADCAVSGIGFDATCSLVIVDGSGEAIR